MSYDGALPDGNGNYPLDVIAIYVCNTGFVLVGENNRTCTGDGSSITGAFNGVAPICEGMKDTITFHFTFFLIIYSNNLSLLAGPCQWFTNLF